MSQAKNDLKAELDRSAALLRTLRDEVLVQIHLGGLDAKDTWRKLEPRLESALATAATEVSEASRAAITELTASVHKLRNSLR